MEKVGGPRRTRTCDPLIKSDNPANYIFHKSASVLAFQAFLKTLFREMLAEVG